MCKCTPEIRTPFCGKIGCEWPKPEGTRDNPADQRPRESEEKMREWWIDPDYDGYFDDTDENLIASGYVKAVEYSAYLAVRAERDELKIFKGAAETKLLEVVKERDVAIARAEGAEKSGAELADIHATLDQRFYRLQSNADKLAAEVRRLETVIEDIRGGFGGLEPEEYESEVRKYAEEALGEENEALAAYRKRGET